MADPAALAALMLDAAVGWPAAVYRRVGHPVGAFARIIDTCEARWNHPARPLATRRILGICLLAVLLFVAAGGGLLVDRALQAMLGERAWIGTAILAAPALAQRSLFDHVRPVAVALAAGDLPAARQTVGMIVGRDTGGLDGAGVARAAIESLAESFCDGIAAPLFWLLVLGLPGIWAYKAVNTADSMVGHREERWRAFGWAAARTDDALNLLPARLAAILICLCGRGGWRILWRDAHRHASPNAGWPEAAMAGALGIRLGGPLAYEGMLHDKPWIGEGDRAVDAFQLRRALAVYLRACLCLWLLAGGVAWVR